MKNILKTVGVFAVAAISLIACQKEVSVDNIELEEFIYSFRINNLDNANTETKSVFTDDGSSVYTTWEDGDQFGAYAISGSKASNNRPSLVTVDAEGFTLNVATTTALDANSTVYTYYPYSVGAGASSSNAVINFASIQTQDSDGYDAVAMPMAGIPFTIDHAIDQNSTTTVGEINFLNLGAIIKFNIFSSTSNTEMIKSVSFKANKNLVGNYTLNLQSVSTSDESTLLVSGSGEYNEVKTILSSPVAVGSSKTNGVAVYMVVAPGAYKGDIVVTTDAHTYTFAVTTEKTFNRSKVKPLNADLANATQGALTQEESWELCSEAGDFTEGTYVIVDASKSYFLSNAIADAKAAPAGGAVSFVDDKLTVSADMKWNAIAVEGGIQFESAAHSGYYLWATNDNNGIRVANVEPTNAQMGTSTPVSKVWTFVANDTYGGEGGYLASAINSRYLTLYATNHDWRNYKIGTYGLGMSQEGQATNYAAMFYKLVDNRTALDAPILQIDGTTVSWAEVENAGTYEVTIAEETTTTTDLAFDVDKLSLDDGYYTITVRAIPEDESLYKASAVATGEVKVGTPRLAAPTLSKGAVSKNAITVNWEAVDEADGYSAMIVNNEDDDFDLVDVTATTVTFTGLTPSTEYTIYVSATDSRDRFAASEQASLVITTAEDVALSKGDAWTYTFESKQFAGSNEVKTLNGKEWTAVSDGTYYGYEAARGQQFGSGSALTKTVTLSSNFGDAYGVENVIINAAMGSGSDATLSVSVGGTPLVIKGTTNTAVDLSTSATNYEFVSSELAGGDIVITLSQTTKKGMFIKSISVNPAPAVQLVMSDISCTAQTSSSVTFGWSAVTGAVGYQVSTDGSTFGSTQTGTSFTLTGLEPETDYYIWVKAIGDGLGYASSDPKKSSVGKTDASNDETATSTLVFTKACGGSGTADDGVEWTVTSDGAESSFDNTKGIHYGTSSGQVQYIRLATSDITGTISKVVVNASTASGVTATVGVTVDGSTFGGDPQSLTTSSADYTFEGSASGEIVVTVTKPSKAAKAIYVKSVVVTYEK